MSHTVSATALRKLVDEWNARDARVVGPIQVKPGLVLYQPLESSGQLLLDGFIRPANSIKEFVFPRHEKLYDYRFAGKQIELHDAEPPAVPQIIVGARPCDAAALPILDHVFNWDYRDGFYNRRRELTTVITLACREHDVHCFCTSVGSGPDDARGSDVLLLDLGNGSYEVRCLTEKGSELFSTPIETRIASEGALQTSEVLKTSEVSSLASPQKRIDIDAVRAFLADGYENPVWQAASQRCLGCGACAFTCPTCHCFDMIDEGNAKGGARVRNWDACQFALFTAHASGHNPRSVQSQRQRQRIYHKFQIYPEKFGPILCTGCGNCTRNCPVGLGVRPVLEAIGEIKK